MAALISSSISRQRKAKQSTKIGLPFRNKNIKNVLNSPCSNNIIPAGTYLMEVTFNANGIDNKIVIF